MVLQNDEVPRVCRRSHEGAIHFSVGEIVGIPRHAADWTNNPFAPTANAGAAIATGNRRSSLVRSIARAAGPRPRR
jgi:hypothetical protein